MRRAWSSQVETIDDGDGMCNISRATEQVEQPANAAALAWFQICLSCLGDDEKVWHHAVRFIDGGPHRLSSRTCMVMVEGLTQ